MLDLERVRVMRHNEIFLSDLTERGMNTFRKITFRRFDADSVCIRFLDMF